MKHIIGNQNYKTRTINKLGNNDDLFELAASYKEPKEIPKINKPSKLENQASNIILPNEVTASDHITFQAQKGNYFVSSIGVEHGNNDWYKQNKLAIKEGKLVQDLNEAMIMHGTIINAHLNKTTLFHPDQNPVSPKIIKDLYTQLASNKWQNLNAFFEKNDEGIFTMKKAINLD